MPAPQIGNGCQYREHEVGAEREESAWQEEAEDEEIVQTSYSTKTEMVTEKTPDDVIWTTLISFRSAMLPGLKPIALFRSVIVLSAPGPQITRSPPIFRPIEGREIVEWEAIVQETVGQEPQNEFDKSDSDEKSKTWGIEDIEAVRMEAAIKVTTSPHP